MTEKDPILAGRRRRFERILKELQKNAKKKGKPTKNKDEKVLHQLKEVRRDLWKKYKNWHRRMAAERKTGIIKCSAKGCRQPADYVWIDAFLPDSRAILVRGEILCYPLCIAHDTMLHETLDNMAAESSNLMQERIRIRR